MSATTGTSQATLGRAETAESEADQRLQKLIDEADPARIMDETLRQLYPWLSRGDRQERIFSILTNLWENGFVVVRATTVMKPLNRVAATAAVAGAGIGALLMHMLESTVIA